MRETKNNTSGRADAKPYQILDDNYPHFVTAAKRAVEEMTGDGEFKKPSINFLYIEAMIVGFIYAQPWFPAMYSDVKARFNRENILLVVRDYALQAATDATQGNRRFSGE